MPTPLYSIRSIIFGVIGIALVGIAAYSIRFLLMPFFLAFVFAYLLTPLVDQIEYGVKNRLIAVGLLYASIATIICLSIVFFAPTILAELQNFSHALPSYLQQAKEQKSMNQQAHTRKKYMTDY